MEIPADAVTADLRTSGNALSLWRCGNATEEEVEATALAIATGGERLDKLDIVWLSDEELAAESLVLNDTDGRTPVATLVKQHVDVCCLDYVRLGRVAACLATAIENARHRRLTKRRVTKLVAGAVLDGRVALADLEEKVREEVGSAIRLDGG